MRHWSLIRMLCWPTRLPFNASSLFPGGAIKSCRRFYLMNLTKLPLRRALYVLGKLFGKPAMEKRFRVTVCERTDHEKTMIA